MICCSENTYTSCLHCGFACDSLGPYNPQSSLDTSRRTFAPPSLISNCNLFFLALFADDCCGNLSEHKLQHLVTFPFSNNSPMCCGDRTNGTRLLIANQLTGVGARFGWGWDGIDKRLLVSPPLKRLFKGPPPSLLGIPLRGWEGLLQ